LLVLSRKQHQSLVIGNEIKITVLEIKGNQVRLGIDAPESIVVHREEIHNKIT
jgi:carbon storage regulator